MEDYSKYENLFGLIGYPLSHSFSKKYFSEKFAKQNIGNAFYELFPIEEINALENLIKSNSNLRGLNVTIPYKEQVLPFLDKLDPAAKEIGAVNTIKIENNFLTGYNTDVYGFEQSLKEKLAQDHLDVQKALVLGTGGAAKAVIYILEKLNIKPSLVSRKTKAGAISYNDLKTQDINEYKLIVNTTPLGMSPQIDTYPDIPYESLGHEHLLYDLVYNPEQTLFMKKGLEQGAKVINGLQMLILQAEKAWEIWNS